jgi:NAD(P)-dependent dehydrogenase (short-subunit alcohol dehydrogenase family)
MQVLITGANRGIGLALAQLYTDAGCKVIATARRPKAGQWPLDVTNPADLANLAGMLTEPIDLLICNAGVYLDRSEALKGGYDAQIWASTFAVNVAGVFHTVQAFLPHLRRAMGGQTGGQTGARLP